MERFLTSLARLDVAPVAWLHGSRTALPGGLAKLRIRRGERGFTLIELTTVVILISVFALLAIPQVTVQLRDRRTQEAAQRIVLVYQQARLRAMGQGGAIMVRYSQGTNGQGSFETKEALVGNGDAMNCALLPSTSCANTLWDVPASGQSRSIETIEMALTGSANIWASLTPDTGGVTGNDMDVCFTPLGRAFVRYLPTDPFLPLQGVPVFSVFRGLTKGAPEGLQRRVLVLPTGIARLQL